jgi:hypothetical protein
MNIIYYLYASTVIFFILISYTICRHYSERVFSSLTLDIFIGQLIASLIPGINLIFLIVVLIDIISLLFNKLSKIELFKLR